MLEKNQDMRELSEEEVDSICGGNTGTGVIVTAVNAGIAFGKWVGEQAQKLTS